MTPAQDRAVALSGRDVCVVAGAGSGKTTVLSERFAHLVLAGRSPRDRRRAVDRLLTLTFTEKAATEMRERVARRFAGSGDADLRRAVETAWISTFHAFCARLLKENAVEAGVDPRFQVLAEGDAALLLEEAREEVVARWASERPEAFAPLSLVAAPSLEDLAASLLAAGPAPAESFADLLAAASNPPSPAGEMEAIRAALRDLASDLERYEGASRTAAESALAAGRTLDGLDSVAAVRSFRMPAGDRKGAVAAKPRLVALREACDAAAGALLAAEAAPAARALAALLGDMEAAYRARKEARGVLDFADLESRALALLEGDAGAREEVRARFDAVLVDEFQDTSPVQERLLAALAGPGRTFTVGDPKQAIYGFRGADVAGFERAREAAGEEGTVVLAENFRSRPEILRFSNAVLAPAFAAGGPDQVPFGRLLPGAAHGPKDRPSVEIHLVSAGDGEGEGGGMGDLRPREAALLAARIRALVEGGEACITRSDIPSRPLGWGDAAILLRATTDVQVYERALADAGIPYQVVKGRGFFEAREVVDLSNLLEALEDPAHDLALAATLRSPFAGLDDRTLLALVRSLPREGEVRAPLSSVLAPGASSPGGITPAMRARLARFRGAWDSLRALRRRGRLHEVLDAALRGTGYADAVLLRAGGRQRSANLRKVLERARSFEDAGLGGPAEFVRLVRRLRLREERETEAPLAAEDAVSLMTVHQAKGLEWPLVVLPDLGRRPPSPSGAVLCRGGRAGLRIRRGEEKTPLWLRIRDEEVRASDAEAVRLFHVALTRAKEHLVLSSAVKGEGGERERVTALSLLAPHLPEDAEGTVVVAPGTADAVEVLVSRSPGLPAAGGSRRVSLALERRRRLLAGRGPGVRLPKRERRAVEEEVDGVLGLAAPAPDGTPFLATVSAVLDWGSCPLRYRLGHEIGVPDRSPPPAEGREHDEDPSLASTAGHGVPRWISGVAAHAVLGTMDLVRGAEAGIRAAAAARMREDLDGDPPEEALEEVVRWVAGFLSSPFGREVRAAAAEEGRLLREVPFLCREEGVLLRGQIDLAVRGDDGEWTLADYKASRPPRAAEKRGRYERQLRIYARALAGVPLFEGRPPARGALVYLDPATEVVPVSLAAADLAPARDLLARFREGTRGEERRADLRHCPSCPFGPGGTASCAAARPAGRIR